MPADAENDIMAANSAASASGRRRGPGRPFGKGTSGNPNGRPKVVFEIRDLARQYGPAAIAKLAELSGLAPGTPAEAEATRVAAIKELLDRGYGKATQPLSSEDNNSPAALHMLAARLVSQEILDAMEQRESHTTIDGIVEPTNGHAEGNGKAKPADLLNAPLPLE
jgi:hypothetical protein